MMKGGLALRERTEKDTVGAVVLDRCGAVSMTGPGEGCIRLAVAKEICDRLAHGKKPMSVARLTLNRLATRIRGAAGSLAFTLQIRFAIAHVTPHMLAGGWDGNDEPTVGDRFR